MVAGIAVCNLGPCEPRGGAALKEQADRLFHCSNLYRIPQQELVAMMLSEHSFPAEVFFCNSGAEANEGAIKLVRKYCSTKATRGPRSLPHESFHGRTLATLAATGQDKYRAGFDPMPEGFLHRTLRGYRCIQGRHYTRWAASCWSPSRARAGSISRAGIFCKVRELCDREGILLVLDEVQTGMGGPAGSSPISMKASAGHHDPGQGPGQRVPGGRRDSKA